MTHNVRQQFTGYVMRDYEQVVATLRQSWISQGVSQREIAERAECQRTEITRWLTGSVEMRARRLFPFAHALGYDLALIPREGE